MSFCSVSEAIKELQAGRFLIVVDDEDRENEGDLVMPADQITPEAINFMTKYARGLICVPVPGERLDELGIPLAVSARRDPHQTAFTMSVDTVKGTTTGISVQDRWATIKALLDPRSRPEDFVQPGHMFPLRYHPGGVLARPGHTEASVDLARLAGFYPAAVICEILAEDGTMCRLPGLIEFAETHGLKIFSIQQLIDHEKSQQSVQRVATARIPTKAGEFTAIAYRSHHEQVEHLALVTGTLPAEEPTLVRIHSECLTGEAFGSLRCDCGEQLDNALETLSRAGQGVLLYLRQEGRGIGLVNKLKAYALQDMGMDTVDANIQLGFSADARDYRSAAQILRDLGVQRVRLLTNNPAKISALASYGLEVVERIPLEVPSGKENAGYLETKRIRMGHLLSPVEPELPQWVIANAAMV